MRTPHWLARIGLIDDARHFWKFASVWLSWIAATVVGIIQFAPDVITQTWNAIPADLRQYLPDWLTRSIPFALIALIPLARVLKKKEQPVGR